MAESRTSILKRFREQIDRGQPIIGGGAGVGLSAKSEELGGIDLIVIYNSGRFRMAGLSSLSGYMPIGDANEIVQELGREVLQVVRNVPVLAGVFASDPFRNMVLLLDDLKRQGFAGIQNFPTMGLIDGQFREWLEQTGYTYAAEVECVRLARERELMTTPYCFVPEEAEDMAKAGADIIVAHMGLTTGGMIGAQSGKNLENCVERIRAIRDAARGQRDDVILLCHGGPIAEPQDAQYILSRVEGIHGFYGASSMERLPTERAIVEQIQTFKEMTFTGR
jgi:predicted TIM-barrel enzyme